MDFRLFFNALAVGLALAAGTMTAQGVAAERMAARPNILLIYTDDQGYGDASCLNDAAKFATPSLDRLAKEGVTFTDAHCSDTVCTPSRYGLLTGRYSWRTRLKRGVMGAEGEGLIADERMTLASLLRDNGYRTAMVGKWHLGMDFPGDPKTRDWTKPVRDMPLDKGFQYFYGIPASLNYGVLAWFEGRFAATPPTLYTNKKPNRMALADYRIKPPYEQTPQAVRKALGKQGFEIAPDFEDSLCLTRFTDKAIDWMKSHAAQRAEQPFFLYLPYTSPHKPVIPLPKFRGQGKAGAYGEFMIETDHHVGRLLKFLDEAKLADNTLVVFTSDNGPETTWKARREKYNHQSNGPYREGKRSIYEGGHRVPFFVRWPAGVATPGRRCERTICQTDLLATFAELLEISLPADAGEDSVSFLASLRDRDAKPRAPVIHHSSRGGFAIREGEWKLVLPHGRGREELYQLTRDPSEKSDVLASHPEIATGLRSRITEIVLNGRTTPGPAQSNDTGYWPDLKWIDRADYDKRQAAAR